jgi:hypothetical protein
LVATLVGAQHERGAQQRLGQQLGQPGLCCWLCLCLCVRVVVEWRGRDARRRPDPAAAAAAAERGRRRETTKAAEDRLSNCKSPRQTLSALLRRGQREN